MGNDAVAQGVVFGDRDSPGNGCMGHSLVGDEMLGAFISGVLAVFFWFLTAATLKGVDWIFISGVNSLPKEERQAFKEKHDMISMNRYLGKRILLPTAVLFSIIAPLVLSSADWMQSAWFCAVILISVLSFLMLIVRAVLRILNFDLWRN